MKSFYTDGIGNQQTLTNSQDEKIPIYDTYSDAQSDLSNLEEGQIVGTKGAFNQMTLVDIVQSGNMNAVTSNAVANAGFLTTNDVADEIENNNMNVATSNAIYEALGCNKIKVYNGNFSKNDTDVSTYGYWQLTIPTEIQNNNVISVFIYTSSIAGINGTQITPIYCDNGNMYMTVYKPTAWSQTSVNFSYRITYLYNNIVS